MLMPKILRTGTAKRAGDYQSKAIGRTIVFDANVWIVFWLDFGRSIESRVEKVQISM